MIIACIDDHDGDLHLIEAILRNEIPDIDIHNYRYLNDFLETKKPYDIVVTDLGLPDAYGPEVIRRIRNITGKPIIVLSGVGGNHIPHQIMNVIQDSGATIFLSKNKQGMNFLPKAIQQFI